MRIENINELVFSSLLKTEASTNGDLAEIVGIMLGDGCLHKEKRRNRYQTIICFHKEEQDYQNYVKMLFESYFGYKFSLTKLKSENLLRNNSFVVGNSLVERGLSAGNKIANKAIIPKWIEEDRIFLKRVVCGLFDTDGCIYKKYNCHLQITFKFGGLELANSLHNSLISLGFTPTKIRGGFNKEKRVYFYKFYFQVKRD